MFGGEVEAHRPSPGHGLGRLLVETLDALLGVGVHDRAAVLGGIDERDVLLDAVVRLHLEAPPVGPHRPANALGRQPVGDLVGLDGVMEGRDVKAELVRHVDHDRHLVGPIAVHLDRNLASQRAGERVEPQVPLRGLRVLGRLAAGLELGRIRILLADVVLRLDPLGAVAGDVAHAGGR